MIINDKVYNLLKFLVEVLLPGAATLYLTLASLWGLPNPESVAGTLAAVALFLGLFLKYSRAVYNKSDAKFDGDFVVSKSPDGERTLFELEMNRAPADLVDKTELSFRVKPAKFVPPVDFDG